VYKLYRCALCTYSEKLWLDIVHVQREVMVHVTVVKVGEVNTTRECFDAEVLIRSRWREPQLDNTVQVWYYRYR